MNRELTKLFEEHSKILLAYLFGSRVQSRIREHSDYDIAVLVDSQVHDNFKYRIASMLCNILDSENVDLVVLSHAPIELAYNVISSGMLLYQRSTYHRVEFEAGTLSKYYDCLPLLRKPREEILEESNCESVIQRRREAFRKTERVLAQLRVSKGKGD